jgi:hypothetical protein
VILYGLIILSLTLPVTIVAFYPVSESLGQQVGEVAMGYLTQWYYWIWLVVVLLSQTALLVVPVRIVEKRPVTKKTILLPIIAVALMMGLLACGLALAINETILQDALYSPMWWVSYGILALTWILWISIFWRWSKNLEPRNFIEKQCRYLFRGSILELLIAVPTHIIARYRDYCCAGFATFVGIAFGLSVMLFSFGPGIFFLYAERYKRLRPRG